MKILIIGASGRIGKTVSEIFEKRGYQPFKSYRTERHNYQSEQNWISMDFDSLTDEEIKDIVIQKQVSHVIFCLPLRYTESVAKALRDLEIRAVFLGSARKLSRIKDRSVEKVIRAVKLAQENCSNWIFIHPTMIYGKQGENNFNRIARIVKKFPLIPLPNGGNSLMQPIHADDVSTALVNATFIEKSNFELVLSGPDCLPYKEIFRKIAEIHQRKILIINLPVSLLLFLGKLLNIMPFLPSITNQEVRRLTEDKDFDSQEAYNLLKIDPITIDQGIKSTFPGT
ncbi:MAG: hypothetical protein VXV96_09805 [Bdellovibrionota bacterium]|nr:hypothetical protein [Bdellovibrionota bacterium]